MTEKRILTNSYAPVYARYWQTEKAIRLRCGEWKPTHKLVIKNVEYNTTEEQLYMEVSFESAGRLPSGGDWGGCVRFFYSYVDWIAYGRPSFGVDMNGDLCNFLSLLVNYQSSPRSDTSLVAFQLTPLDEDGSDDEDFDTDINWDDEDEDEEW